MGFQSCPSSESVGRAQHWARTVCTGSWGWHGHWGGVVWGWGAWGNTGMWGLKAWGLSINRWQLGIKGEGLGWPQNFPPLPPVCPGSLWAKEGRGNGKQAGNSLPPPPWGGERYGSISTTPTNVHQNWVGRVTTCLEGMFKSTGRE